MTQSTRAAQFAALHTVGTPLILYNIWDAGSAQAVAKGGASDPSDVCAKRPISTLHTSGYRTSAIPSVAAVQLSESSHS